MKSHITPAPLEPIGRLFVLLTFMLLLLIWIAGGYSYTQLPDKIPTHFDFSGKPDAFGTRNTFLILPFALSIAPIIILVVVRFRFKLVNDYPYLVNLPAFFTQIGQLSDERRTYWYNKYFEFVAAVGVAITSLLLALLLALYWGTVEGSMPWWFIIVVTVIPIVLVTFFILALRSMSARLRDEIG